MADSNKSIDQSIFCRKIEDLIPSANLHLDGAGAVLHRGALGEAQSYCGANLFPQSTLGSIN